MATGRARMSHGARISQQRPRSEGQQPSPSHSKQLRRFRSLVTRATFKQGNKKRRRPSDSLLLPTYKPPNHNLAAVQPKRSPGGDRPTSRSGTSRQACRRRKVGTGGGAVANSGANRMSAAVVSCLVAPSSLRRRSGRRKRLCRQHWQKQTLVRAAEQRLERWRRLHQLRMPQQAAAMLATRWLPPVRRAAKPDAARDVRQR